MAVTVGISVLAQTSLERAVENIASRQADGDGAVDEQAAEER